MKKNIFLITLLAAAIAIQSARAGAPGGPAMVPEVEVVKIVPREITVTQELNGRVTPYLIAEVRPQVNGIILGRMFAEGADVTAGMPLYQIDPAMYDADLNRSQAALARAKANVDVAEAKLNRYRRLIQAKAVNQQEYDEVEAATKQAQAEVGIAEAEVRVAGINVNYARVVSPISGRIGKSSVTQGALVTASQPAPLAVVQQLDPIYVDVTLPASAVAGLKSGLTSAGGTDALANTGESHAVMRIQLDDGSVYGHAGKLLFADVTVDQTTGSITLRAEFPNPDHTLLPGMFVIAVLDLEKREGAIVVPARALSREVDGSPFVLVVAEDGTVSRRRVAAGRTVGPDGWLVEEGVSAGEMVVVSGGQRLRFIPGAPAPKATPVVVNQTAAPAPTVQ